MRNLLGKFWYADALERRISPDGAFYMAQAAGEEVPTPYRYRCLLPRLLGSNPDNWVRMNTISLILFAAGLWVYTGSAFSLVLLALFPVTRTWQKIPVLQDLPSLAITIWAANAMGWHTGLGILVSLMAGLVNEKAPLFAALYSWSPFPLVGYLGTGVIYLLTKEGEVPRNVMHYEAWTQMEQVLANPFSSAIHYLKGRWHETKLWVQPWGGMVLSVFNASTQMWTTLLAAYAMVFIATDSVRVMCWALPVVAAATCGLPIEMKVVAVFLSWFWGWGGDRI